VTPQSPRFTVTLAGRVERDLERLAIWAERHDLRTLLAETLRSIIENLETQPREWGDPYFNYRALNAVAYGKTIAFADLRVVYAVHATELLVWLSVVRPLPTSPFSGG
jgi:hypothetical protein